MGIPNMLFVTEQTQQGPRQMNLYSRMLDGQIIFLNGKINAAIINKNYDRAFALLFSTLQLILHGQLL